MPAVAAAQTAPEQPEEPQATPKAAGSAQQQQRQSAIDRARMEATTFVERKSGTAWLQLPSARRSRILHLHFHLPVSYRTSAHRIVCCGFHPGNSLNRWSRVWVWYWHYYYCEVAWFFVQRRY